MSCFAAAVAKTIIFGGEGSRKKKKRSRFPELSMTLLRRVMFAQTGWGKKKQNKKKRVRLEDVIVRHHAIYICTVEIL